jgi:hypothetical protein
LNTNCFKRKEGITAFEVCGVVKVLCGVAGTDARVAGETYDAVALVRAIARPIVAQFVPFI